VYFKIAGGSGRISGQTHSKTRLVPNVPRSRFDSIADVAAPTATGYLSGQVLMAKGHFQWHSRSRERRCSEWRPDTLLAFKSLIFWSLNRPSSASPENLLHITPHSCRRQRQKAEDYLTDTNSGWHNLERREAKTWPSRTRWPTHCPESRR
jgi:hypothetical protein